MGPKVPSCFRIDVSIHCESSLQVCAVCNVPNSPQLVASVLLLLLLADLLADRSAHAEPGEPQGCRLCLCMHLSDMYAALWMPLRSSVPCGMNFLQSTLRVQAAAAAPSGTPEVPSPVPSGTTEVPLVFVHLTDLCAALCMPLWSSFCAVWREFLASKEEYDFKWWPLRVQATVGAELTDFSMATSGTTEVPLVFVHLCGALCMPLWTSVLCRASFLQAINCMSLSGGHFVCRPCLHWRLRRPRRCPWCVCISVIRAPHCAFFAFLASQKYVYLTSGNFVCRIRSRIRRRMRMRCRIVHVAVCLVL